MEIEPNAKKGLKLCINGDGNQCKKSTCTEC